MRMGIEKESEEEWRLKLKEVVRKLKLEYMQLVPVMKLDLFGEGWGKEGARTTEWWFEELQGRIYDEVLVPTTEVKLSWSSVPPSMELKYEGSEDLISSEVEGVDSMIPSVSYQLRFLKELVGRLETQNQELDDRILELYMQHLSGAWRGWNEKLESKLRQTDLVHKRYYLTPALTESDSILLTESRVMIGAGTTGLRTWQASLLLGQYLLDRPEIIRQQRVLELGSGVGFLGLVTQRLSPSSLTLTDYHPQVLTSLTLNLLLNSPPPNPCQVTVDRWDWEDVTPHQLTTADPTVILGADVTYDPATITPLVALLHQLLLVPSVTPRHAYLCCTVRTPATYQFLLNTLDTCQPPLFYTVHPLHPHTCPRFHLEDTVSEVHLLHITSPSVTL